MKPARVKIPQKCTLKEVIVVLNKALGLREHRELKSLSDDIIKTLLTEDSSQTCVANKINELLYTKASRILGLELLNLCLPYFTLQINSSCAPRWLRYCLECHDCEKEIHLETLTNIIKYSQNRDQFNKTFVTDFLTPTLIFLINKSNNLIMSELSLNCLIVCLQNYSSSCNAHRMKINNYILTYLSSGSNTLVSLAGTAFFYAQHIGNAGKEGENHKEAVTLSMRKLCATCHVLFNSLFEDQVEFEHFDFSHIQPYDIRLESPNEDNILNIIKLQYRSQLLKNCLEWLSCFLSRSTTETLYPKEILGVIQRGMSVHLCREQNYKSIDKMYFAEFLIEIQMECIKTLRTVILNMGVGLAPYHSITQIMVDTIKRSLTCKCYNEDIFQERLHDVFLLRLKAGRCKLEQNMSEQLISSLILAAFPDKEKLQNQSSREFVYTSKMSLNSLNVLHILLDNTDLVLSIQLEKKLLSSLINTILYYQKGILPKNEAYEIFLYKIICLIIENDQPLSPIHIVSQLLIDGCKNKNPNISNVCYKGLRSFEKICHPVFNSLDIAKKPIEFEDVDTAEVEEDSMEVQ